MKEKIIAYVTLARISNSPTIVTNVLTGIALAGGILLSSHTLFLVLALVAFYTAGMYANDLFDLSFDRRFNNNRPLVKGVVSPVIAAGIIICLFIFGSVVLFLVSIQSFLFGMLLIGCILLYDIWHKTNPLSPVIMGFCRVLVYAIAFVSLNSHVTMPFIAVSSFLLLYIIGITLLSKIEQRKGFITALPLLLLVLPINVIFFVFVKDLMGFAVFGGLFLGWVIYSIRYMQQKKQIGISIAYLLAGISLYDGLVLATIGYFAGAVICLGAFFLTLFMQRFIKGT